MRILVTGSRDWNDLVTLNGAIHDAVLAVFSKVPHGKQYVTIVHGKCPTGADALAVVLASYHAWDIEPHPADWQKHGKAAGPIRNQEMVDAGADVCLAFIKNNSRGATHCADAAEKAGIPVRRYRA